MDLGRDNFEFFVKHGVIRKEFGDYFEYKYLYETIHFDESDDYLIIYLKFFKEKFYKGLTDKEIYQKLLERIEKGIFIFKRKTYRFYQKIQDDKNNNK